MTNSRPPKLREQIETYTACDDSEFVPFSSEYATKLLKQLESKEGVTEFYGVTIVRAPNTNESKE